MDQITPSVPFTLKPKWNTSCFGNLNDLDCWVDGFGVTIYGANVGVRVSDPSLIPGLKARMPEYAKPMDGPFNETKFDVIMSVILGGKEPGSRTRKFHLSYQNHTNVGRSHRLEEALDKFDAYLALSVAYLAPRHVFIHAGCVGWKGKAIIIPGLTLSGKSSLTKALVEAGCTYYSDEFAVLDKNGRVFAWPKSLSMRENPTAQQQDVPIEEIGGVQGHKMLEPGLVVMSKYKEGVKWRPKKLTSGETLFGLMENCVGVRYAPDRSMNAMQAVVAKAKGIKSSRGEAVDVAQRIIDSCEKHMVQ
ncbi:MAG: hypothetical protein AAF468_17860 [Pseudomonadota bacterium]